MLAQLATPSAALVSLCFSGHVCNIFVEISLKMTLKSLLSTQLPLVFRDDSAAVAAAAALTQSFSCAHLFSHSFIVDCSSACSITRYASLPTPTLPAFPFDLPLVADIQIEHFTISI